MDRENIYKYFILQADLWQMAINWLRKKVENTEYQNTPYKINHIHLIDGGCIDFNVTFLLDDTEINMSYKINVKDLENI